jgi:hypothetical protein
VLGEEINMAQQQVQSPSTQPDPTPEDRFRELLRDVISIIEKLAPHCSSISDLVGMARLAIENDGQCRLMMDKCSPIQLWGK